MGKVSSLNHFPLGPGHEDYSFLDQGVAIFEQGLDSVLTDSIETPELDTFFDKNEVILPSLQGLQFVSTVSDISKV